MSEFYICHKFVGQIRRNISTKYFDFYSLTHHIIDEGCVIFIAYNPILFDIDVLIVYIAESAKSSDVF